MKKENSIVLNGIIRDIMPSHTVGDIEYSKAHIVTKRKDGKEDILSIKFKKYSCPYRDNQTVSLKGNIRSYSKQCQDGKNTVDVYVFTYFDDPTDEDYDISEKSNINNHFEVIGTICKMDTLHTTKGIDGAPSRQNVHYIVANNIISDGVKLNSYLPCVSWGVTARGISKLPVGQKVLIQGEFHSKEYKKILPDNDYEIRVAHELVVSSYELIQE